jgi:hypothetical protein
MGDIDGGFDHRQDKALGAEAIELQVSYLGLQQARAQIGPFRVSRQKLDEAGFGELEKLLALPEGVISIQSDRREPWFVS